MKVIEVYYQSNFPLADKFIFEHIGVKLVVEEGEDAKEVLKKARQWTILQHKAMNPNLYKQVHLPADTANGQNIDSIVRPEISTDLPTIQNSEDRVKPKPSVIELRKMELTIKNNDELTQKELSDNYNFPQK